MKNPLPYAVAGIAYHGLLGCSKAFQLKHLSRWLLNEGFRIPLKEAGPVHRMTQAAFLALLHQPFHHWCDPGFYTFHISVLARPRTAEGHELLISPAGASLRDSVFHLLRIPGELMLYREKPDISTQHAFLTVFIIELGRVNVDDPSLDNLVQLTCELMNQSPHVPPRHWISFVDHIYNQLFWLLHQVPLLCP